jgi:hypothetical protein
LFQNILLYNYRCATCSLILGEEHIRKVSQNTVLIEIYTANRDGIKRDWRKLPNVELNNLYLLPNIIRMTVSRRLRGVGYAGCI